MIETMWSDFRDGLRAAADDIKDAVTGWRDRDVQFRMAALAIVIVIGAAVRIAFLGRPMLVDESVSYLLYASQPFAEALSDYSLPNNHLLNTALMRISVLALGNSPPAVRLPALAAGIAGIGAAYVCFKTLYNPSVGLLGSALVAGASAQINYSSQGRGYSLITLMFLLMITLACRLRRQWNTAEAIGVGLLGVVAMYAVPTGLYAVAVVWIGLGLALVMDRKVGRDGRIVRDSAASLGIMGLLTVLLYLPPVLSSGWQAVAGNAYVLPLPFEFFLRNNWVLLGDTWAAWNRALSAVAIWLIAAGALAGLIGDGKNLARRVVPVAGAVLGLAAILTIQRVSPFVRVWTFLQPVYLGAAAAGLWMTPVWLPKRIQGAGLKLAKTVLAVALTGAMSQSVLRLETDLIWDMPDQARRAPQLVMQLKEVMKPGDVLTGSDFATITAAYYLSTMGYPDPWLSPIDTQQHKVIYTPKRIYVVVRDMGNGTLMAADDFMKDLNGIRYEDYYRPVEAVRANLIRIYVVQRKSEATP